MKKNITCYFPYIDETLSCKITAELSQCQNVNHIYFLSVTETDKTLAPNSSIIKSRLYRRYRHMEHFSQAK